MYMRMVTYIGEIYPEKVCALPEQLFKNLMASIEFGLASYPFFGMYVLGRNLCCRSLLCSLQCSLAAMHLESVVITFFFYQNRSLINNNSEIGQRQFKQLILMISEPLQLLPALQRCPKPFHSAPLIRVHFVTTYHMLMLLTEYQACKPQSFGISCSMH